MHYRTLAAATLAFGLMTGAAQATVFHVTPTNSPYTVQLYYSGATAQDAYIKFVKAFGGAANMPRSDAVVKGWCQPKLTSHSIRNMSTNKVTFGYYRPYVGKAATGCKVNPAP